MNYEIAFFDVISLFVTGLLALYVAGRLAKESEVERCEKNAIIKKIEEIDSVITLLQQTIHPNTLIKFDEIVSLIGRVERITACIQKQIGKKYPKLMRSGSLPYTDSLDALDDNCTNDKNLIGKLVLSDMDGVSFCSYDEIRSTEIESVVDGFLTQLFELQLNLNRY